MKKSKRKNGVAAVTIISGSDGPTSVFLAGKRGVREKNPLRRLKNWYKRSRYEKRRANVVKSLVAKPHTPDGLAAYLEKKYHAKELAPESQRAKEGWRNTKSSIVWREHGEKMEELGYAPPEKKCPQDMRDMDAVRKWHEYMEEYDAAAAGLDEALVPLDYHIYEISVGNVGTMEVQMEKIRGLLNVSFCSAPEHKRRAQEIMCDIYRYYGVTQEDIDKTTDRYLTLVTILTDLPRRRKRGGRRRRSRKR